MSETSKRETSEEEIDQEIEKNAQEPFDMEKEMDKVGQYYQMKKGELMGARREISETFGFDDTLKDETGKTNLDAVLEHTNELMFRQQGKNPLAEDALPWFYPATRALILAKERVENNKDTGEEVLKFRERNEMKKRIADLAKRVGKI